jgi:hypothetical protein
MDTRQKIQPPKAPQLWLLNPWCLAYPSEQEQSPPSLRSQQNFETTNIVELPWPSQRLRYQPLEPVVKNTIQIN